QDEKGFIDRAPNSMSTKDKETEAEIQREYFKEIYSENTKNNMQGFDVTDKEIEELTDSFLSALAKTKYKISGSKATSEEEIIVTVSAEGIDEAKIYADTEKDVKDVVKEKKLNQKEAVSKNIEILSDHYKAVENLEEPIEVDVHVAIDNGEYIVLEQDEYLAGFVRQ